MKTDKNLLRNIPQVGKLLEEPSFLELQKKFSRGEVLLGIKNSIEEIKLEKNEIKKENLKEKILKETLNFLRYPYRKVINATGILIHTNLGRAPLIEVEKKIIEGYSNLEILLKDGKRGERNSLIEKILTYLTNSEKSIVVNNNAAAIFLLLSTFAKGGEVVISRGELVEIGGSFRLPEILKESGCIMVEVGTTNKTKIEDYEKAISDKTRAILKVHQSNYRIVGFTEMPPVEEVCALAHKKKIPFFVDQGNGLLFDIEGFELKDEEPVLDLIKKGVDVVTFSGDKLLGGPQAGIAVGKKEYIEKMMKNPLYRAFRPGKETFFYLQETLKYWLKKEFKKIPLWKMAMEELKILKKRAKKIQKEAKLNLKIIEDVSKFGGGTAPTYNLPSISLKLEVENPERVFKFFLEGDLPVITYIKDDSIIFNLRSVFEEEDKVLIKRLKEFKINENL